MPSFVTPISGNDALAEHVAQITEDFQGLRNIPLSVTGINEPASYALTLKNAGAGAKGLIIYAADGTTVLLQVDSAGVKGSIDGVTPAVGLVTTTGAATLTNKTLDSATNTLTVRNAALAADTARANLLTNGGFEVWQRGVGPFTGNGVYSADRWLSALSGTDTLSISKDTANTDTAGGSLASAACTFVLGTGAGSTFLAQVIKSADGNQIVNRSMSLSVRVKSSVIGAVRIGVHNGSAWTYSTPNAGTAYETLTVTATMGAAALVAQIGIFFAASCTAYVDNAMLVVGSVAADYAPLHPADELARCLRYYEVIGGITSGTPQFYFYGVTGVQASWWAPGKAIKAATPTVTKNGTWAVTNCAQPALQADPNGMTIYTTVTATGSANMASTSAAMTMTAEANP
jgi:hypothetical protein